MIDDSALVWRMSGLSRNGTAELVSRDQILRRGRGQGKKYFPVQLTTSRIGSQTRSIHTLLEVLTIHHTVRICVNNFCVRVYFFNQYLNEIRGVFPRTPSFQHTPITITITTNTTKYYIAWRLKQCYWYWVLGPSWSCPELQPSVVQAAQASTWNRFFL